MLLLHVFSPFGNLKGILDIRAALLFILKQTIIELKSRLKPQIPKWNQGYNERNKQNLQLCMYLLFSGEYARILS